jgi:hypothetical protein
MLSGGVYLDLLLTCPSRASLPGGVGYKIKISFAASEVATPYLTKVLRLPFPRLSQ